MGEDMAVKEPVRQVRHGIKAALRDVHSALDQVFQAVAGTPGLSPEDQKARFEALEQAFGEFSIKTALAATVVKEGVEMGLELVQARIDDPASYEAYQAQKPTPEENGQVFGEEDSEEDL